MGECSLPRGKRRRHHQLGGKGLRERRNPRDALPPLCGLARRLPSLERCRHAVIAPELDDIVEHTHIADCKQVLRLLLDSVPSTLHSHGAG